MAQVTAFEALQEGQVIWSEKLVLQTLKEVKEFLDGHRTPIANQLYDKIVPMIAAGEWAIARSNEILSQKSLIKQLLIQP